METDFDSSIGRWRDGASVSMGAAGHEGFAVLVRGDGGSAFWELLLMEEFSREAGSVNFGWY